MTNDTTAMIGKLITEPQERDAIHIAVTPIQAGCFLIPGSQVGLTTDGKANYIFPHIGVVDPYLKKGIDAGQWFWLFLNPGSITSLKHNWTHPAFKDDEVDEVKPCVNNSNKLNSLHPNTGDYLKSIDWLKNFAYYNNLPYNALIDNCSAGTSITSYGQDFHGPDDPDEFWHHMEIATGKHFDEAHRDKVYFSCAC